MLKLLVVLLLLVALPADANEFDVVLIGGRVMDPASGLDAIHNVGIRDDTIAVVTDRPINGTVTLDVSGLVVAPGFIDLHVHGQTNEAALYQAHDGVTTALELEAGMANIRDWIASREGRAIINFGASASQATARARAMREMADMWDTVDRQREHGAIEDEASRLHVAEQMRLSFYRELEDSELHAAHEILSSELQAGAIGIGLLLGYLPGATPEEVFRLFEFTGARDTPVFVHTRDMGIHGFQEVISNAAITGTPLHIVHMNSLALADISLGLEMIEAAQEGGLDVTTEIYPYTAASTALESAMFDAGWQEKLGIGYEDLQWVETGERLSKASFEQYRKTGGTVIIHMMQEAWIEEAIRHPATIIASDGMPYAPGAHPRSAGTFARVLGRYVREKQSLSLMQALAKMTIMPAKRLESIAPGAARKGRLQPDMDADITVFDPNSIMDRSTFERGLRFSSGVVHVFVNGTRVVADGATVEGAAPGRPLYGKFRS